MSDAGKGAGQSGVAAVEKFGFDVTTCCGYLPQVKHEGVTGLFSGFCLYM